VVSIAQSCHHTGRQPGGEASRGRAGGDDPDDVPCSGQRDGRAGCSRRQGAIQTHQVILRQGENRTGRLLQRMHPWSPISLHHNPRPRLRGYVGQPKPVRAAMDVTQGGDIPARHDPVRCSRVFDVLSQFTALVSQQDMNSVGPDFWQAMRGRYQRSLPCRKSCAMSSRLETGMIQPGDLRIGGNAFLSPCAGPVKDDYEQSQIDKGCSTTCGDRPNRLEGAKLAKIWNICE